MRDPSRRRRVEEERDDVQVCRVIGDRERQCTRTGDIENQRRVEQLRGGSGVIAVGAE